MRVCAVQTAIVIALCGVALSHPNYGQLLDRQVTVKIVDLSFEAALKEIGSAARVKFAYSIDHLEDEPNVSLSIEGRTLRVVLKELFAPRNIRYVVHESDAVITLKKVHAEGEANAIPGPDQQSRQLTIRITGTVTDALSQTPMPGVNVLVKGTSTGTTTSAEGRYALGAGEHDVLIFSFIGYAPVETAVNGRTVIDIAMTEDVLSLGEVVVNAGYWDVKEKEQTGNISRITARSFERQPVSNPLQALQGRMTGVYIQQNTGVPGGGISIRVRGQNSLRTGTAGGVNGNLPLYLIDGVPFSSTSLTSPSISNSNLAGGNPLSAINPADIESIEVLKDADATAIYGSRGSNGVVLITTKHSKSAREKIGSY